MDSKNKDGWRCWREECDGYCPNKRHVMMPDICPDCKEKRK